jgi:Leucine-rich repeat (LRR) protein
MKRILLIVIACNAYLFTACSSDGDGGTEIVNSDPGCTQIVNIPDANFKAKLVAGGFGTGVTLEGSTIIDANGDGEIQVCEAENVGGLTIDQADIQSIEGILAFRNIESLSFKYNSISHPLDLSSLKRLVYVMLTDNEIPTLKVTGLSRLKYLACDGNNLQTLNVSGLSSLETLYCQWNQIAELNIQNARKLQVLRIYQNNISQLSVGHLTNLQQLYASDNLLTTLDVSGLSKLQDMHCDSNNLQSVDAGGCIDLRELDCNQNNITSLILTNCAKLQNLHCYLNDLSSIDLSDLTKLSYFDADSNLLTSIDLRNSPELSYVSLDFNPQLQSLVTKNGIVESQGVDFYQCPALANICCDAGEQAEMQSKVQTYGYTCTIATNCF